MTESPGNESANSNLSAAPPGVFGRVRIVLVRPSHPGNIGAAARAIKTMGFSRLALVRPKAALDGLAEAMASGADDVLAAARSVASLSEALAGVSFALALTSRRRDLATAPLWARAGAGEVAQAVCAGAEAALVFGNETSGLTNAELALCNRWAMIPANPDYPSLNLAAAVQVMCYELRLAIEAAQGVFSPAPAFIPPGTPATLDEVEGLLSQIERMALDSGFLDPARPGRLMLRLRRLFSRASLEREEVNLLRGLLASFVEPTGRQRRKRS